LPDTEDALKPTDPQRTLDGLIELATRLPWWGSLLSALASYALLHPIAILQVPTPIGMVDVVATALAQLLVFVAQIAQYLLPAAFLLSASVSGFGLWKRRDLREFVAQDTTGSILRGLARKDFELVVSEAFRRQGYEPCESHKVSRERATALELTRNGKRYLVDCADWRSWKAGKGAVRKLYERMETKGADGGFAVTSGQFTPEAKHFAADKNIGLVDGRHLKELIRSQPKEAKGQPALLLEWIRSILARWQDLFAFDRRPASPERPTTEPRILPAAGPAPKPRGRASPSQTDGAHSPADDAETATGQQLTALIRAERAFEDEVKLSAPPVQGIEKRPPQRRWHRPRARKIADAVGVLVAIGILWGVYEWFSLLPDTPADTPWALLGTSGDSPALARRMQELSRTVPSIQIQDGKQTLGQFRFGPPGLIADLQAELSAQGDGVYNGLRELEAAFEAKYVPPPECYAWASDNQMVKCGNHRIRTRRAFIDSGGQVTATLLGSWEEPREVLTQASQQDWRLDERQDRQQDTDRDRNGDQAWDQDWRWSQEQGSRQLWDQEHVPEPGQDWRQELGQGWRQGPAEGPPLEPQEDWRQEWTRRPAPDQAQDWRQDWLQSPQPGADGDWIRGADSEPAPVERRHWVDGL
jgi:restriction system protein